MEEKINVFFSPEFEGMTLAEQFQKFGEVASKLADASALARIGSYDAATKTLTGATEEISGIRQMMWFPTKMAIMNENLQMWF